MNIVWLASYPKSGNTWVRFLLYTYMRGFPSWSRQLRRTIPDIYIDPYDPDAADPMFIKTHEPYSPTHKDIHRTRAAILITRHPADVLRSHWRWHKNISHDTYPNPAAYADAFIHTGGDPNWTHGTITEHFESWTNQTQYPVLHVRYEDLAQAPARQLLRMAEFAGLDADPQRAEAAAEQCTKARMRRFEWKQKLLRRPKGDAVLTGGIVNMLRGHSFVSKPNSSDPLDALAPDIENRINERFAPLLSAMNTLA